MQDATRRRTKGELGSMADALPDPMWSARPDGYIDFVNRRWHEYIGDAPDAVPDAAWCAALHPDDRAAWFERWKVIGESREPWESELRLRRADGAYRWFLCRAAPVTDSSGRIIRWNGTTTDIDERRRAEHDLRVVETTFSGWMESFPGLMVTMSVTGEVELFSREVLEYFGKTRNDLRNWAFTDAVHPDDLPHVLVAFRESVTTGKPYRMEHRCRRADGVYHWFQIRGLAVRGADGQITGWYVVLTDIDDLKRAENALRASERQLRLIVDSIPALAWSAGTTLRAEFFNQHYLDFVGLTEDEARGLGWMAAVHPDDLTVITSHEERMLATGSGGEFEARLRRHDGQYRWFLFRTNPLRDENGSIVRWYGVNTDIEDRKQAQEQLRRSEAFLAEGQYLSATGSFSWCPSTGVTTWSDEVYRIFAFDRSSPLTIDRIGTRIHPDDQAAWSNAIERTRSGEALSLDFRLAMPGSEVKYLHAIAHVVVNDGGLLECIGAVQDVTARKRSEEALDVVRSELARVSRITSLGALTASIAHEVNQPLSGIVTNAGTCLRMLDAEPPNVDGARETAKRTIRDGNRAADVIARLRALFARKDFAPESLDLNEATREVIVLSQHELQRNRVILQAELTDDLPTIEGDRVQLQQVILNLLRNATEAMNEVNDRTRELTIRTDREADRGVRLTVRDAGMGVGTQPVEKLFDPFYTTKHGGMGIGLSVSRSIIENHNGHIWATRNDSVGLTVAFSIPGTIPHPSSR